MYEDQDVTAVAEVVKLGRFERAVASLAPKINPNPVHSPETLERLFTHNYQHLKDEASVPGLPIEDISELLNHTAGSLSWYTGPDEDGAFRAWITDVLRVATARALAFAEMRDDPENQAFVKGAIGKIVRDCRDLGVDLGNVKKDIESPTIKQLAFEVWTLIRAEFDEWLEPGKPYDPKNKPPKLTTRLSGKARKHTLGWRKAEIAEQVRLGFRPKPKPKVKKSKLTKLEKQLLEAEKAADPSRDGDHDSPLEDDLFIEIKKKKKKRDNLAFIA